jgi:hypothetical protein
MSLNWNLSKIKNHDELCWLKDPLTGEFKIHPVTHNKILNPLTDGIIWYTMVVGIGDLTENTVDEFYARMCFTDALHGPILLTEGGMKGRKVTLDELKAHIGLHTNVAYEKKESFLARHVNGFMCDIQMSHVFQIENPDDPQPIGVYIEITDGLFYIGSTDPEKLQVVEVNEDDGDIHLNHPTPERMTNEELWEKEADAEEHASEIDGEPTGEGEAPDEEA